MFDRMRAPRLVEAARRLASRLSPYGTGTVCAEFRKLIAPCEK
jgi:hypothetical protein